MGAACLGTGTGQTCKVTWGHSFTTSGYKAGLVGWVIILSVWVFQLSVLWCRIAKWSCDAGVRLCWCSFGRQVLTGWLEGKSGCAASGRAAAIHWERE